MNGDVEFFDSEWLKEAEDRLTAYTSGELNAVDAEQVFAELDELNVKCGYPALKQVSERTD